VREATAADETVTLANVSSPCVQAIACTQSAAAVTKMVGLTAGALPAGCDSSPWGTGEGLFWFIFNALQLLGAKGQQNGMDRFLDDRQREIRAI
jgi:hypothetical protein